MARILNPEPDMGITWMLRITNMFGNIFRNRIFAYYFFVFIVFTVVIILFQYNREKEFKQSQFESILDNVTGTTARFLEINKSTEPVCYKKLDSLISIIPVTDIRISILSFDGVVLYDSYVDNYRSMENHANRSEIAEALENNSGSSIRTSATTGKEYFYYARMYDDIVIRAAAEYTLEVKSFLRIDKLFIVVILILFILVLIVFFYINNRFRKTIGQLKYFASKAKEDQEKIFRHLQVMEVGIAIFSSDREIILSNNAFIQNANLLSNKTLNSPEDVLKIKEVKPVIKFIKRFTGDSNLNITGKSNFKEIICQKKNRYFMVRCNMFGDSSFEIILKDVTKTEKNKVMKQQLTANIAHELRTPVTSIVGYLETLLSTARIDEEQRMQFLDRTRDQALRLAELIDHISVLNRLEEGTGFYKIEKVCIYDIITEVADSMLVKLQGKEIKVEIDISKSLKFSGNMALIYSIFQNLFDNTLNYAGDDIISRITLHYEDENYYYFRYSNSGRSIPDEHLPRLFERFYRIDEGRSRKKGGTGLGLAIVKHAVQFHQGQITVKNLDDGGVEFLFSIGKRL